MIRAVLLAALLATPGAIPAAAQQIEVFPDVEADLSDRVAAGRGAMLRGLDKRAGDLTEMELLVGQTVALGRLQVTLGECRYPRDNPTGDAYAYLVIREAGVDRPEFAGWMIASSPALSALEHPRYDIWVLRCTT